MTHIHYHNSASIHSIQCQAAEHRANCWFTRRAAKRTLGVKRHRHYNHYLHPSGPIVHGSVVTGCVSACVCVCVFRGRLHFSHSSSLLFVWGAGCLCMLMWVFTRLWVQPKLTRFQVLLLQHRQPLGPRTEDGDSGDVKIMRINRKKSMLSMQQFSPTKNFDWTRVLI